MEASATEKVNWTRMATAVGEQREKEERKNDDAVFHILITRSGELSGLPRDQEINTSRARWQRVRGQGGERRGAGERWR